MQIKKNPTAELSPSQQLKHERERRARKQRRYRERVWSATLPGTNMYLNPDLRRYMAQIKTEEPDFAEFLERAKRGELDLDALMDKAKTALKRRNAQRQNAENEEAP